MGGHDTWEITTTVDINGVAKYHNTEIGNLKSKLHKRNVQIKRLQAAVRLGSKFNSKLADVIMLVESRPYNETDTETLHKIRRAYDTF